MKARAHLFITGEVQGVFFRSFIKSQAKLHEIRGWVKNLDDGRVEAVFESDDFRVKDMIEVCRRGPPGAVIKDVEVTWENVTNTPEEGFEIRR